MTAPAWLADAGRWLEDRVGLSQFVELGRHKQVPLHKHSVWYYMGGMTLFLFGIQVATGILLLLYYRPSAGEAFESVQFLMARVPFGWLIRSIHSWSANLLVFVLFLHMFSAFFLKAFRKPRELTWLTGVGLMALMMGFGFSGYLLPWNTLAFFATQVGTEVAGRVPMVGEFALRLLRGGDQVTGGTLTRFYGIHVAILPALTTAILGAHLMLVQKHGMSVPPKIEAESERTGEPLRSHAFLPNFLIRDAIGWCGALGVLAGLAAVFPWELGVKADPFASAPAGIRPEWYFGWMFQSLKMLPAHILGFEGEVLGILAITAAALVWLVVPFVDRTPRPGNRVSLAFIVSGWLALVYMAVTTAMVYWPVKG